MTSWATNRVCMIDPLDAMTTLPMTQTSIISPLELTQQVSFSIEPRAMNSW